MAFDERRLADAAVADKDEFELGNLLLLCLLFVVLCLLWRELMDMIFVCVNGGMERGMESECAER